MRLKKLFIPLVIIVITATFLILFNTVWKDEEGQIFTVLKHINRILFIAGFTFALVRIIRILKHLLLKRYDISVENNLKSRKLHTQYNVIERIMAFILILLALGTTLMTFPAIRNVGVSVFASAGVAGLVIGLAAQRVIGSVLAGIQIAFTQPIRIEDVVIVEGEWGWIEEITLTYVVVRIWDKRRLIVPSTYFIEKPFQNWTRVSADILGTVYLYTDYMVPFHELRKEQTRLLKETPLWDGLVDVIQITDARETTVEVRSLVSAKDSPTAWDLRVMLREKLIEFIRNNYPESLPRTRVELNRQTATGDHS